ncbi:hypothetical protein L228DRAFT_35627 [Xylona heveae TC161]|uniref:Uncharacterized protein n=1 Tax=Xylona heveae (strain CBS 132557 / TC161) TaxID=1328760 RepID=A0A165A8V0_XYLHT|nr:hypothetical protein L228DRAFT_35627 [Xylona heveae TC161]KZF20106.1 hypothetical protein L228DRAFT_35627 [Xylona heveae TC161]
MYLFSSTCIFSSGTAAGAQAAAMLASYRRRYNQISFFMEPRCYSELSFILFYYSAFALLACEGKREEREKKRSCVIRAIHNRRVVYF